MLGRGSGEVAEVVIRKYYVRGAKSYFVSDFVESADAIIRGDSQGSIEVSLECI